MAGLIVLVLIGCLWDLWTLWRLGPVAPPDRAPVRERVPHDSLPAPSVPPHAPGGRIDLNRADAAELDRLPGIGPVLASRIVAYRSQIGGFHSPDELLGVRGIGPRLLERILPDLLVEGRPTGSPGTRSDSVQFARP